MLGHGLFPLFLFGVRVVLRTSRISTEECMHCVALSNMYFCVAGIAYCCQSYIMVNKFAGFDYGIACGFECRAVFRIRERNTNTVLWLYPNQAGWTKKNLKNGLAQAGKAGP